MWGWSLGLKFSLDKFFRRCYTHQYSNIIGNYCLSWFHFNRLSRKRLDFNNRFMLYPRHICAWGRSTWPSNQILFGEVCHDFSLNEQARESTRRSAKQGCLPGTGLGRTANPRQTLAKSNWKEWWFEKHKNRIHKRPADVRRPAGDGTTAPASQRGAVFFVGAGHPGKRLLHVYCRQRGAGHCRWTQPLSDLRKAQTAVQDAGVFLCQLAGGEAMGIGDPAGTAKSLPLGAWTNCIEIEAGVRIGS